MWLASLPFPKVRAKIVTLGNRNYAEPRYARHLIMCGGCGGARAGREVLPVLGGIIAVSEVVEECEQPVRRTVAAGFSWEWCDPGESAFLDRHVGVEIGAARGFDS